MDENYKTLLHIKENQLIKAFERNNMSCMIVKDEEELHHYLKNIFLITIRLNQRIATLTFLSCYLYLN